MEFVRRTSERMLTFKRTHRFIMLLISCLSGSVSTYTKDHSFLPVVCDDQSIFSYDRELAACQSGKNVFITRQDGEWESFKGELEGMTSDGVHILQNNGEYLQRCRVDNNFRFHTRQRDNKD